MRPSLDFSKINGAAHPPAVQPQTCRKAPRHRVGFVGVGDAKPAQDIFPEQEPQRRHLAKLLRSGR